MIDVFGKENKWASPSAAVNTNIACARQVSPISGPISFILVILLSAMDIFNAALSSAVLYETGTCYDSVFLAGSN